MIVHHKNSGTLIPNPWCFPNVQWPTSMSSLVHLGLLQSHTTADVPFGCCQRARFQLHPGISIVFCPTRWPRNTAAVGFSEPTRRSRSPGLCWKRVTSELETKWIGVVVVPHCLVGMWTQQKGRKLTNLHICRFHVGHHRHIIGATPSPKKIVLPTNPHEHQSKTASRNGRTPWQSEIYFPLCASNTKVTPPQRSSSKQAISYGSRPLYTTSKTCGGLQSVAPSPTQRISISDLSLEVYALVL